MNLDVCVCVPVCVYGEWGEGGHLLVCLYLCTYMCHYVIAKFSFLLFFLFSFLNGGWRWGGVSLVYALHRKKKCCSKGYFTFEYHYKK